MEEKESRRIHYTIDELDEYLRQVKDKDIYNNATVENSGLMSSKDKKKLDGIRNIGVLSTEEIINLLK